MSSFHIFILCVIAWFGFCCIMWILLVMSEGGDG